MLLIVSLSGLMELAATSFASPIPFTMKNLIVYFSFTGNNKLLTERLSTLLDADVLRITEPRKRTGIRILFDMLFNRSPRINPMLIDWAQYEHIILIAPIYDYKIAHPMRTFLRQNKAYLKKYSFVTLCIGRDGQDDRIQQELIKWVGTPPKNIEQFLINDLVLPEQKGKAKYVTNYTVAQEEMETFEPQIQALVEKISADVKI